jgi:phosphoribosylformylglycinamidine synthase subunit PurS
VFHSKVVVTLRKSILDPQGKAVEQGVHSMGYQSVGNIRMGKYVEFDLDVETKSEAEQIVREISTKLLSNPVMEDYTFTLEAKKQ